MFIELVDSLRCPHDHEDSWLVATVFRRDDRRMLEGVLGCPVCRAQYQVHGGVADFRDVPDASPPARPGDAYLEPDAESAVRAAALLDLAEPGGIIALGGDWAAHASALAEMAGVQVVALNAPAAPPEAERVSALRVGGRLPLRANALRALALDAATAHLAPLAELALRTRARLVLPAAHPAPPWATHLASDALDAVYERQPTGTPPIPLTRRRTHWSH